MVYKSNTPISRIFSDLTTEISYSLHSKDYLYAIMVRGKLAGVINNGVINPVLNIMDPEMNPNSIFKL